jgi:glutamyl-Q tRNA(Asp) synthetase
VTLHHPLLHAPDGRKLSKRDRSETVKAMRARGMTREEVLEEAGRG